MMEAREVLTIEEIFEVCPGRVIGQCPKWIRKTVPGKKNHFLLKLDTKGKNRLKLYKKEGDNIPHNPFVLFENDKIEFHPSINTVEGILVAFENFRDFNTTLPVGKRVPPPRIKERPVSPSGYSGF